MTETKQILTCILSTETNPLQSSETICEDHSGKGDSKNASSRLAEVTKDKVAGIPALTLGVVTNSL